jgi:tetratricopeptide (TPR) repeat protein
MFPSQPGREALVVGGPGEEKTLLSGMRITFPNWSLDGREISCWATFVPTHESLWSLTTGSGLRAGDPAARIDVASGRVQWMPVSSLEKLQIGNFHLLQGNAAEALRLYDEATPNLPDLHEGNRLPLTAAPLYRSICYARLGRHAEAADEYDRFVALSMQEAPPAPPETDASGFRITVGQPSTSDARLLARYQLVAEVFLSADAAQECRRLLEAELVSDSPWQERLARLVTLSQVLLLQEDHGAFAHLAVEELLPLCLRELVPHVPAIDTIDFGNALLFASQLSLLPMFSREFFASLDTQVLHAVLGRLSAEHAMQKGDLEKLVIDRMLARGLAVSGDENELHMVEARLKESKTAHRLTDASIDEALEFFGSLREGKLW